MIELTKDAFQSYGLIAMVSILFAYVLALLIAKFLPEQTAARTKKVSEVVTLILLAPIALTAIIQAIWVEDYYKAGWIILLTVASQIKKLIRLVYQKYDQAIDKFNDRA